MGPLSVGRNAVDAVRDESGRVLVDRADNGRYRWRAKASNGRIVAISAPAYSGVEEARRAYSRLRRDAPNLSARISHVKDGAGWTLNNTDYTCIDIARSSRGPNTGSTDYFIPFATDAVGWSAYTGGNAPANLTSAELKGIYNCTYTTWNSLPTDPTTSTDTIKVYLPQSGSGTRSFFLSALGITATSEPCWQSVTPEENEGTDAAFTSNSDAIFPYSLSHYVGQVYDGKGSGNDEPGSLDALRSLDSTQQILTATKVWNSALSLTYTRQVFHVVRENDWNGTGPGGATEASSLKALLNRSAAGGWLCKNGASLITSYGFQALSSGCGTLQPGI
jgi:ABC-type phosphate transport system substrate-binding protein